MPDDIRLDLLKAAITNSDLDGLVKDQLADDLRHAQMLSGKDPVELALKRILISGIRRELLAHDRVKAAVKRHVDDFHDLTGGGVLRRAIVSVGLQLPILAIVVYALVKLFQCKFASWFAGA